MMMSLRMLTGALKLLPGTQQRTGPLGAIRNALSTQVRQSSQYSVHSTHHGRIIQCIVLADCIINTFTAFLLVFGIISFLVVFFLGKLPVDFLVVCYMFILVSVLALVIFCLKFAGGLWKATIEPANAEHHQSVACWCCMSNILIVVLSLKVIVFAALAILTPHQNLQISLGAFIPALLLALSIRLVFTCFVIKFANELRERFYTGIFLAMAIAGEGGTTADEQRGSEVAHSIAPTTVAANNNTNVPRERVCCCFK